MSQSLKGANAMTLDRRHMTWGETLWTIWFVVLTFLTWWQEDVHSALVVIGILIYIEVRHPMSGIVDPREPKGAK